MQLIKILLCFGTRPEAIKMAPIVHALKKQKGVEVNVCVTAQHRQMLDQVLDFFEITPDYDLDLMMPNQSLNLLSSRILEKIDIVLLEVKPDWVLVHGDTTTSAMVAIAAFHQNIKVGHVEAGLRTYNKQAPFPEEVNRQLTSRIADVHFAPTNESVQNLVKEGILKDTIFKVGNTVVDALQWAIQKMNSGYHNKEILKLENQLDKSKKLILVTGHRRENFGDGFLKVCEALIDLSEREDVEIVYPVHLNPKVQEPVYKLLSNNKNIHLIPPAEYPLFIWLMQRAALIISDSGGIQEEAPTLGKRVLVTRNVTERKEGIDQGFSILVGTDKDKIVNEATQILEHFKGFDRIENPYGDGKASERIVEVFSIHHAQKRDT
ncbi:MAG: UDP-N-acetylglucosamine 2-epimerase (non-hydrolyzing) [Flavobacteriaceae bacterium]|nr:UDP-N-acetylglucosamine 2-epimerase (non-hydrolyzing) [Flavobacteriaceae bacterium]